MKLCKELFYYVPFQQIDFLVPNNEPFSPNMLMFLAKNTGWKMGSQVKVPVNTHACFVDFIYKGPKRQFPEDPEFWATHSQI